MNFDFPDVSAKHRQRRNIYMVEPYREDPEFAKRFWRNVKLLLLIGFMFAAGFVLLILVSFYEAKNGL